MSHKLLTRAEYEDFLKALPKGYCSLCNYKINHNVLYEGKYWVWMENLSPYWYYHTLLIPKRHIIEFGEITDEEVNEFRNLTKLVIDFYRKSNLARKDKSIIKKYIFFWRLRDDLIDPVSGNTRPDHFHVHIAPDKDHLWDPVLDTDAHLTDFSNLKLE